MPIKRSFDFGEGFRQAASDIRDTQAVGAHAFLAEEPVPLSVFVQDRKFLANPPLSDIQYEAVRHIERIYTQSTYPLLAEEFETGKREGRLHIAASNAVWREEKYWSAPIRMCNFVTMQWGKGSGKDHVVRIGSMRVAYLLLCLNSPQKYYGLPEQDTIHLLNVASNSAQAQQAFFMPIVRAVKTGWFADKCIPRQNLISYAKNIESISGHSDAESQEGLNLLLGVADEIDAFKSKKELTWRKNATSREPTKSAEGILNMMRTSSATRFPEVFKNVRISYPRYLGSTIQQLTALAREDNKERKEKSRHYVSGPLATWEVNPRVPGRETFAEDYREDPVMARAKYECRPDRAINPYFRNVAAVDSAFELVDKEPLAVSYKIEQSRVANRRVWVPVYTFSDKLYPIRGANYTLHADLAVTGDRAGVCMAHVAEYEEYDGITEDEDGASYTVRESRPKIKVDFCIGFSADQSVDPPREIQIRWARQLCFELIKRGFNITMLSFDAFESRDSMQILEERGITSERISTTTSEQPWRTLRDLIYEGRIVIPRLSIENMAAAKTPFLLRDELLALSRMPNGKVDHPSDGCFTGDTRIPLLDGTAPHIRDLDGKAVQVYSLRPDGTIVPGKARGRCTKYVTHLVDIVLGSGYAARCTPDHRWMLRDGSYKAAADLYPGVDALMPVTFPEDGKQFQGTFHPNHIRAVIPVTLTKPVPVYDLEVDQWSNFALTGGVAVHNSKDLADALAVATMTAIQVGGREEGPEARRYYEPDTFTTGARAELPFGLTSRQLADIWTTSLSPF